MDQPPVIWSWIDGVIVVAGAFAIYIVGSIVVGIVDYVAEGRHTGFWVIPVSYLWLTFGAFFMIRTWLVKRRGGTWGMVGFRVPHARSWPLGILWLIGLAFIAYIVTLVGTVVIVAIFSKTGFHIKSNVKELLPKGQTTVTAAQFITLMVTAGILAPVTEETLFRGALYQGMLRDGSRRLGRRLGIALAALIVGGIFGLFHLLGGSGELYTLPLLAFLGIVLCLTFQFTGSLGGAMLLHAAVNSVSVVAYYGSHLA